MLSYSSQRLIINVKMAKKTVRRNGRELAEKEGERGRNGRKTEYLIRTFLLALRKQTELRSENYTIRTTYRYLVFDDVS